MTSTNGLETRTMRGIEEAIREGSMSVLPTVELGTTAPAVPVQVAHDAANDAHAAISASHHAAELLRQRGDDILMLAQTIKAQCEALALDTENRANQIQQFIAMFAELADQTREMCKAEQVRFSGLQLPGGAS